MILRLYPAHFREEYGEEAFQLFRDRLRDEPGFFPRLRLWFDILLDATISIPREYLHVASPRVAASAAPRPLTGLPGFYVFQNQAPRPAALLIGSALSVAALTICWSSLSSIHRSDSSGAAGFAGPFSAGNSHRSDSTSERRRADTRRGGYGVASTSALDESERKRVISSVAENLRQHYVDRAVGQRAADLFLAREKRGEYDDITDRPMLAAVLTQELRESTGDRNLVLDYFSSPLSQQPMSQSPDTAASYRETMKQQNCTIEKVELLPRNIGYLKFNSFPDLEVCRVNVMAAMTYVNHADAVIFDLRENRGGEPATVQFVGSYLFDHPEYWYNPREATTAQSWTQSPVPGSSLADKPVFLLTSRSTASGAEQFCYDLKMLKRATLVGETTAGAAHSGMFHRLDDHFGMGIPEVKAINPYSSSDWTEVGVEPDVKVSATGALDAALKLARARLSKK